MKKRFLPGHLYAIVGVATDDGGNKGYLIQDPYGKSVGEFQQHTDEQGESPSVNLQRGRDPVSFLSEDEAKTILKGSIVHYGEWSVVPNRQQPIGTDGRQSVTEDDEADDFEVVA